MNFGKTLRLLVLALAFLYTTVAAQSKNDYKRLYAYAEKLSNAANHTDKTDEIALKSYLEVIHYLTTTTKNNLFLFQVYVNTGAFLQALGRQNESISYFKKAIAMKTRLPSVVDSVLFRPLVYCGNAYYTIDKPDTAESLYKKAQAIADRYPDINEVERLYNTLGVISYSKGNYSESTTYYEKAISILLKHPSYDKSLLVAYKNNLATAFNKLKKYGQALQIFQSLLPYKSETDKLFHNIGSTYLAMGETRLAIHFLKKVSYEDKWNLNDLGSAYLKEENYSEAIKYLQKSADLNKRINKGRKNSDYGITLKYFGDVWFQKKQFLRAISFYQQSIINLLPDFNSNNIYTNPTSFKSAFNGIELLETLSAKARAFQALYAETRKVKDLESSLQTSLGFYKLANYISRFYETDESRLLISDRKYFSREQPINICLQLFKITGNKKFIETAFLLDEENKASILSLYLEKAKRKAEAGIPSALLQDEFQLKENITRIALKASAETDNTRLAEFKNVVNELTIKLLKVQEKINQKAGFNFSNTTAKNSSIDDLQKIIPTESAILSYHITDSSMICFVITNKKFDFFTRKLNNNFFQLLKDISASAQQTEGNNTKQIRSLGRLLYQQLISPGDAFIKDKSDLMIIPDNGLHFLPFELLVASDGKCLLNKFTLTYNYSCHILENVNQNFAAGDMSKLGMAPFDENVMVGGGNWNPLPATKQEIQSFDGVHLFNKLATKQEFLKRAHDFNIIHLATHAYANDLHPEQSCILFYPEHPESLISYKLYMPEIYNLKLNKTRLIVLSACESGVGQLAKGEGLMSISRAFSYSGCDNIITSMWKADDASTAYISGRLYYYLKKGSTITESLRKSKLDYLQNPDISSSKKLAGFWAQLRLTGNFERRSDNNVWIYLLCILLFAVVVMIPIKKGRLKN